MKRFPNLRQQPVITDDGSIIQSNGEDLINQSVANFSDSCVGNPFRKVKSKETSKVHPKRVFLASVYQS